MVSDPRNDLKDFVAKLRAEGKHDDFIREELSVSGWSNGIIDRALGGVELAPISPWNGSVATSASASNQSLHGNNKSSHEPIAVVQNLSTRGYEYYLMFIGLWGSLVATLVMAHLFIDNAFTKETTTLYGGSYSQSDPEYSFWITLLVVLLPVYLYFFRRLRIAESKDTTLRKDPSRKKLIQTTQTVAFIACIVNLLIFVYAFMNSTSSDISVGQHFLHLIASIFIAGGTFFYYWRDEHRA